MKDVKRYNHAVRSEPYTMSRMYESTKGTYVTYEDYEVLKQRLAEAEAVIQKLSALELQRGRYLGTNGMGHEMHDAPYFKVSEINTLIAEADKFLGLDDDE